MFVFLFFFEQIHFHYCVYFRVAFSKVGFSGLAAQVGGKLKHWGEAALGLTSGFAASPVTWASVSLSFFFCKMEVGDSIYPLE